MATQRRDRTLGALSPEDDANVRHRRWTPRRGAVARKRGAPAELPEARTLSTVMTNALQDKDAHWRRRPNGASPVVDPGMAGPGVDSEAGGAASIPSDPSPGPSAPLPSPGADGGRGPILPPSYWYAGAAVIAVAVIAAAIASL
ncbi:hypothetical protein [Brevundimonas lutea]|uniref:hypothetical protein n=1 Tax=Brevundimonas lutea TaxID=2293980 RepID=UPI000F01767D|nr:hypothetical protein [Brevundimonas lutea]